MVKRDFNHAVITGGAGGLGLAIARQLNAAGTALTLLDIDAASVEQATTTFSPPAEGFSCDVSDIATFLDTLEQIWTRNDGFDLLINNAGVMGYGRLDIAPLADFQWMQQINVVAPWQSTRWFYMKHKQAQTRGHVINISSEHGIGVPHIEAGLYTATKHALFGLSEVMAQEMVDQLDVTIACPGIIATNLWASPEKRPDTFGGRSVAPSFLQAIQAQGMSPDTVANCIVEGARQGVRFVLTHPHLAELVRDRADALTASVATFATPLSSTRTFAVPEIVRRLKAEQND